MSWLARSIANSLNFDDDDANSAEKPESKQAEDPESDEDEASSPTTPSRGVKEDLSEISKTLTRQFWGVASFLAPPPQPQEGGSDSGLADSEQDSMLRIRDDFAEIGGKFRSGISRLSNNINVSEITKMASNLLQLESDDENEEKEKYGSVSSLGNGAIGVTEEVVAFARDISMHPETWLDFPLAENEGDDVDFDMSEAQQEHALAVEQLAPRLAALRIELCPGYMSESCFWKIYFVLVHPRLDKNDSVLLSTPQIMEARALLANELKKQKTITPENLSENKSLEPEDKAIPRQEELLLVPETGSENAPFVDTTEKVTSSDEGNEIQIVDNSAVEEKHADQVKDQHFAASDVSAIEEKHAGPVKDQQLGSGPLNVSAEKDEDDADDWLNEEETSEAGDDGGKTIPIENDEDVSFSDLEEDDANAPTSYRKSNYSSDKDSRDWVQL